jgi:hypothetical protein
MKPNRGRRTTLAILLVALAVVSAGVVAFRTEVLMVVRLASREVASIVRTAFLPAPDRGAPRPRTRIIQLYAARAEAVAAAIASEFSAGRWGESSQGRRPLVAPHAGTNSLILQASPEDFTRLLERIEELDGGTR